MNDNYFKIEANIDIIIGMLNNNPNISVETKQAIIERLNEISDLTYASV
jgi:uncharacterized protein YegJ (DUF2314 family)